MPTDFYWTLDGDLAPGKDGDIRDTSFDEHRSTFQEMRTRSQSSFKDWALHPNLGANLEDLIGQANNKLTAERGKASLVASFVLHGFMRKEQIKIRYIPLSKHKLVYFIEALVLTSSGASRLLKTQLLYDTIEGGLRVI